jgi:hypothetical protein
VQLGECRAADRIREERIHVLRLSHVHACGVASERHAVSSVQTEAV